MRVLPAVVEYCWLGLMFSFWAFSQAGAIRLRLAAAQCGMPMAFRLVLLNDFFLRLSLRKRGERSLPERPSLSALCGGKPSIDVVQVLNN